MLGSTFVSATPSARTEDHDRIREELRKTQREGGKLYFDSEVRNYFGEDHGHGLHLWPVADCGACCAS